MSESMERVRLWSFRPEAVKTFADHAASPADVLRHQALHPEIEIWLRENLIGSRDRVLDLCCAQGSSSEHLACTGASVVGVDASPLMVDLAQKNFPQLSFTVGDVTRLDNFRNNYFSAAALTGEALSHIAPPMLPELFESLERVVEPGSPLLLTGVDPAHYGTYVDSLVVNQTRFHQDGGNLYQAPTTSVTGDRLVGSGSEGEMRLVQGVVYHLHPRENISQAFAQAGFVWEKTKPFGPLKLLDPQKPDGEYLFLAHYLRAKTASFA